RQCAAGPRACGDGRRVRGHLHSGEGQKSRSGGRGQVWEEGRGGRLLFVFRSKEVYVNVLPSQLLTAQP
uniref:Uncharacterized protein n=1 Tax=Triticum urartu TaxID=4572 RepID=A0A8R7TNG6_TRIUA